MAYGCVVCEGGCPASTSRLHAAAPATPAASLPPAADDDARPASGGSELGSTPVNSGSLYMEGNCKLVSVDGSESGEEQHVEVAAETQHRRPSGKRPGGKGQMASELASHQG